MDEVEISEVTFHKHVGLILSEITSWSPHLIDKSHLKPQFCKTKISTLKSRICFEPTYIIYYMMIHTAHVDITTKPQGISKNLI